MRYFFLWIVIASSGSYAQSCEGVLMKGDTLIAGCDSILYLRAASFYQNGKNHAYLKQLKQLQVSLLTSRQLYENALKEKEKDYQLLKTLFEASVNSSRAALDSAENRITMLNGSLNQITQNLSGAKEDLQLAKKAVIQMQLKENEKKLRWGLGGAATGALLTLLTMAVF